MTTKNYNTLVEFIDMNNTHSTEYILRMQHILINKSNNTKQDFQQLHLTIKYVQ